MTEEVQISSLHLYSGRLAACCDGVFICFGAVQTVESGRICFSLARVHFGHNWNAAWVFHQDVTLPVQFAGTLRLVQPILVLWWSRGGGGGGDDGLRKCRGRGNLGDFFGW